MNPLSTSVYWIQLSMRNEHLIRIFFEISELLGLIFFTWKTTDMRSTSGTSRGRLEQRAGYESRGVLLRWITEIAVCIHGIKLVELALSLHHIVTKEMYVGLVSVELSCFVLYDNSLLKLQFGCPVVSSFSEI